MADIADDVKTKAISFIRKNLSMKNMRKQIGKLIIYGYSWGGDTVVELAEDLKKYGYTVNLLITVDASIGPLSGDKAFFPDITFMGKRYIIKYRGFVDREIPENVKKNINFYNKVYDTSRVQSKGNPNTAVNPDKTVVVNIPKETTHAKIDELTQQDAIDAILDTLLNREK